MDGNFSYWEKTSFLPKFDYLVVGSGIVGLFAALRLRERFPEATIGVLEKGALLDGASVKNAGFACFGSASELLDDLTKTSEQTVVELVEKRYNGLKHLRNTLGDENISYEPLGGYEVFLESDESLFNACVQKLDYLNELLHPIFHENAFSREPDRFGFSGTKEYLIKNKLEGQLDTGKMMRRLLYLVMQANVQVFNKQKVVSYHESSEGVTVYTTDFQLNCSALMFATNGFASELLDVAVTPGRAQVLITKPIENLNIEGCFHLDRGYYYFRNIDNRILFGGGRNLDFKGETTAEFGVTDLVQSKLVMYLNNVILPGKTVDIDYNWSGIMGLGNEKNPIVKQLSNRTYCGVRMGGMGVAIGSLVGTELANLA